jgi:hypothetical protein
LNNFKEKFTQIYLAKSIVTALLIILLLAFDFIRSLGLADYNQSAMGHLNVLSRINSKVKYINLFTLETILKHEKISIEELDMVEYYGNLIYDDLNSLTTGVSNNFHFSLDTYKNLFFKISNEDICRNFFLNEPTYNFTSKFLIRN